MGNLVSRGKVLQNTGLQNANFGIRSDGMIVVGYLHESDVENKTHPFQVCSLYEVELTKQNLVAGVVWLVRNGKNYVDTSRDLEDTGTQNTGSLDTFITIKSARAALGRC